MAEAPTVGHIGFGIVAHARAPVGMRADGHRAIDITLPDVNSAGSLVPGFHLLLSESRNAFLVILVVGRDAYDWITQRVLYGGIEVEIIGFVGKGRLLHVAMMDAISVLPNESLPVGSPGPGPVEGLSA